MPPTLAVEGSLATSHQDLHNALEVFCTLQYTQVLYLLESSEADCHELPRRGSLELHLRDGDDISEQAEQDDLGREQI